MVGVVAGAAGWSLTEYAAHRWHMHGRVWSRGPVASEHRAHHADPLRTRPILRVAAYGGIGLASAAIGSLGTMVGRTTTTVALAVSWFGGYTVYETLHHRAHHRAVRWGFERPLRARHVIHHEDRSGVNFGVTTAVWDQVFDTAK